MPLTRDKVLVKLKSGATTRQTKADAVRILAGANTPISSKHKKDEKKQKKKYNIK